MGERAIPSQRSWLARVVGTDGARKATGHETNKAFDSYSQYQADDALNMAKIVQKKSAAGRHRRSN